MLTILALEIMNSGKYPKQSNSSAEEGISNEEIVNKLTEEQILREKKERIENIIEILPVLILAAGIILMHILAIIYF